jgi:hypothetical protein
MQAFQRGYPGLTIYLTSGYGMTWAHSGNGRDRLAHTPYGLLAPFLDGMEEAAARGTRLVDGHALDYALRDTVLYRKAYRTLTRDMMRIVANPARHRRVYSIGFCVWTDFDWQHRGWRTDEPDKNYFSPAVFESSVRKAFEVTDEYVWIYSETPRWWSEEGRTQKLPDAYDAALRRLRREFGLD